MKKEYEKEDGKCVFFLEGRISAENSDLLKKKLTELMEAQPDSEILLDARKLEYISSAGLRVFLGLMKKCGKKISIRNVSVGIYDILDMTGFTEIMNVERQMESISTKNCKFLGAGRSSNVYRLNSETIVKKYDPHVPIEKIRREMTLARKAFIYGISTAIPFDIVKADDSLGVVFELIAPADTVGNTISAHMERFEELTKKYTALLKQLHHTKLEDKEKFPSIADTWMGWLEGMKPYYSEEEIKLMEEMLRGVPQRVTLVHCDYHENNVLVQNDELFLIDMADIGYGHPIFDLAGGAFRAHTCLIPGRGARYGLSVENMQVFWKTVLRYYFETEDSGTLHQIQEMCDAFGLLRSALFPMKHVQISEELRLLHVNDARTNLFPRRDWALQQVKNLTQFFPENED